MKKDREAIAELRAELLAEMNRLDSRVHTLLSIVLARLDDKIVPILNTLTDTEPEPVPEMLLTVKEAANILGLHITTVRGMCHDGRLDAVQINERGDWRIPKSVVRAEKERRQG